MMSRKLWNPDDLDRMRMESDPIGDAVVDTFENDSALAATLLDSLVRTGEPTPDHSELLRTFRQQNRSLPPWADKDKILKAQELLSGNLVPGTILLAAASLPQCYLDRLGTPVLTSTHQLTDHVFRRLIQTSHMVFTVYEPGSLFDDPNEPEKIPDGIHKAQTVRLMHALMRHLLMAPESHQEARSMAGLLWSRRWDVERYGKPVNQEDEALVLLTFSYITIEGFERLALILDDGEKEAILHLWNCVGYIMGINEGLMAHTYADAKILYSTMMARLRGVSPEGQMLTKSLVEWINSLLPPFLRWFDAGGEMINFFNGDEDAEMLGVGPSGLDSVVHSVIAALLPPSEKVARKVGQSHPFTTLVNYLADKMIDKVWEATESGSRNIEWPDHVRVAAGRGR